jgi:hypothetical protein
VGFWQVAKLLYKSGGICVNAVACKSMLCDQIAIVPAYWLNCVQTDSIFFLALVTHEYWWVIACHEIWQNWQGGLGVYAQHLREIFTYWLQSKMVELERMIPRSLHTTEAHYQDIYDVIGGGDWSDFFHHSLCFSFELV